jgi:hypothetical protein
MHSDHGTHPATAVEVRNRLAELETERALAIADGLGDVDTYMADLADEIEGTRQLLVVSAVTEIATLRGELFGVESG